MTKKASPDNFPVKYTDFDGWYANEQNRWELSDKQLEVLRKRRAARIAKEAMSVTAHVISTSSPAAIAEELPSVEPAATSAVSTPASHEDGAHAHEKEPDSFRATTFEEAQQLANPLPGQVIDGLIESEGDINLYSFVEPDESDKALTLEQSEDYYYNGIASLKKDFAREVDGRYTLNEQFVFSQFDTTDYAKRRAAGETLQVTDRIYLNPKQLNRLEIYREFLNRAEQQHLAVRSKIYQVLGGDKGMLSGLRQDAIVIYATPENRDETLALVQDIYMEHKDSFEGRTSAPTVCELAPGLAVGSEPVKFSGTESLTSYRKKILDGVYDHTVKYFAQKNIQPTDEQFKHAVRKRVERTLLKYGVDPHNWSFDQTT